MNGTGVVATHPLDWGRARPCFFSFGAGTLCEEFIEIESVKHAARPQLAGDLDICRLTGAVLVIAKLDRLLTGGLLSLTRHVISDRLC